MARSTCFSSYQVSAHVCGSFILFTGPLSLVLTFYIQIYDKSLKRKDFSGIIDKEKAQDAKDAKDAKRDAKEKKKEKAKAESKDDPKAGANIGKIVQLFSSDAVCGFSPDGTPLLYH